MQKAPVMKGSGLKPLDEGKSGDQPIHVFGSNLESRVVAEDANDQAQSISFDPTPMKKREEDDIETIRKRKFDAITGEEDEETIFQGEFKLFAWDLVTSNWIEKGRGQLKLNDSFDQENKRSRIIMRVGGTLKIVLNVAIRHSTFRVIANTKTSIRFTDSQTVWAASGSNAGHLRELIDERLEIAAKQEAENAEKKAKTEDEQQSERGSSVLSPDVSHGSENEQRETTKEESGSEDVKDESKLDNGNQEKPEQSSEKQEEQTSESDIKNKDDQKPTDAQVNDELKERVSEKVEEKETSSNNESSPEPETTTDH